jgi:hypothetical protein
MSPNERAPKTVIYQEALQFLGFNLVGLPPNPFTTKKEVKAKQKWYLVDWMQTKEQSKRESRSKN